MARVVNNILLNGISGAIGKRFVMKQYGKKAVMSAYPDMANLKPSKAQKGQRNKFSDAVAYACSIVHDPKLKAVYQEKIGKRKSVYHHAIKSFLKMPVKKGKGLEIV